MDALLGQDGDDLPGDEVQLGLPLLVRDLQVSFGQDGPHDLRLLLLREVLRQVLLGRHVPLRHVAVDLVVLQHLVQVGLHPVPPVDRLVPVTRYLEHLPTHLVLDDRHVRHFHLVDRLVQHWISI